MNDAEQAYLSHRPKIREDVVFGPAEQSGRQTIYHLKDRRTNWFYRIRAREHFLISRMDGQTTLQEIGEAYAREFNRSLDGKAWGSLFQLLEKRQLLADSATPERIEALKVRLDEEQQQKNRGLLRRRFPLLNPDRFLDKLLRRVRFAFHPVFVVPVLVASAALELSIVLNWQDIGADAWSSRQHYWIWAVLFAVMWLSIAVHELAHGLAVRHFGGSAREIGLIWRYLTIAPYCKVDDVMLFHNRKHRIYTAFAGIFSTLPLLLAMGALWHLAPAGSPWRSLGAMGMIMANTLCLVNLIPFIELDGYFMLNHILGMVDLRKEANHFWSQAIAKGLLRRGSGIDGYDRRSAVIYAIYGLFSLFFTVAFMGGMAFYWYTMLYRWMGVYSVAILVLALLAVLWVKRDHFRMWMQRAFQKGGAVS